MTDKHKKRFLIRVLISATVLSLLGLSIAIYSTYRKIFQPNVKLEKTTNEYLYIPTGSTFDDVVKLLYDQQVIINTSSFIWVAEKKDYPSQVKAGRYKLKNRMSNNELVNMLRAGLQSPVKLRFTNIRTKQQLAGIIGKQIEADSISLLNLFQNDDYIGKYGLISETALCMFIPNTYEFWWNTSAEQFVERMNREYEAFWTDSRKAKAEQLELTPVEVITLASIVDEESYMPSEYARIAGVYLNRLKKGMRLQADPTVKFAHGDFTLRRILHKHLEIDSPYNTYLYAGLPPGPICIPEVKAIDAVLNAEKHHYLYFCARPDLSGYHAFASTLSQHNQNARIYQQALNRMRVK